MLNMTTMMTRIGHLGKAISDSRDFSNSLTTDITNLLASYTVDDDAIYNGASTSLLSAQAGATNISGYCQQVAINTVNTMVSADNLLLNRNNINQNLLEVLRQMNSGGTTIQRATLTSTVTPAGSNQGNGVVVVSTKRGDGLPCEQLFPEKVTFRCSSDQDSGSAVGREGFTVQGQDTNITGSVFGFDWPGGSGASTFLNAVPSDSGSMVSNGSFDAWTGIIPDGWQIVVGGPKIQEGATVYQGAGSLQYIGDGSTLCSISQAITPTYYAQYAVNCWIRADQVSPQTGVLVIELVDGSGAVINDFSSNANTFSKALNTLTVNTWTNISGTFRIPQILPATAKVRIRLSTALTNSTNLFLDSLSVVPMQLFYIGGPSFSLFSGSSAFYIGDSISVTLTNNFGGASNLNNFQTLLDRLFSLRLQGLLFPSASSPTISNSLIS